MVLTRRKDRADYPSEKLETFVQMSMLIRTIVGEDVCLSAPDMIDLLCRVFD